MGGCKAGIDNVIDKNGFKIEGDGQDKHEWAIIKVACSVHHYDRADERECDLGWGK
jgi:hypothetical protein